MPEMDNRKNDLSSYRMTTAKETLIVSKELLENAHYKDSINRSYYAVYYAIKAVLAIEGVDYKKHKDVVAYFNQHYVATDLFERDMGRMISRLQQKREKSDYDDFFIAAKEEAELQCEMAEKIINQIENYLGK